MLEFWVGYFGSVLLHCLAMLGGTRLLRKLYYRSEKMSSSSGPLSVQMLGYLFFVAFYIYVMFSILGDTSALLNERPIPVSQPEKIFFMFFSMISISAAPFTEGIKLKSGDGP